MDECLCLVTTPSGPKWERCSIRMCERVDHYHLIDEQELGPKVKRLIDASVHLHEQYRKRHSREKREF